MTRPRTVGEMGRLAAQRDHYGAALRRIRVLHFPYRGVPEEDMCAHCSMLVGLPVAWPCPTIRAVEGA